MTVDLESLRALYEQASRSHASVASFEKARDTCLEALYREATTLLDDLACLRAQVEGLTTERDTLRMLCFRAAGTIDYVERNFGDEYESRLSALYEVRDAIEATLAATEPKP